MRDVSELSLVLPGQQSLFDLEPPKRPELSQWHTPPDLCARVAKWVPRDARVLEPSAGGGNLIAALIAAGHSHEQITGVELDPNWAEHARQRFNDLVRIITKDFLTYTAEPGTYTHVVANPPFEKGLHAAFVEHALTLAQVVIAILPHSIEYGLERDRMWREKARVTRRARLPGRVSYGGSFSASFETVVLRIERRTKPRPASGEIVMEEVWHE